METPKRAEYSNDELVSIMINILITSPARSTVSSNEFSVGINRMSYSFANGKLNPG